MSSTPSSDLLVNIVIVVVLAVACLDAKPTSTPEKMASPEELLDQRPPWLKPCRRKDPKLNECMRSLMADMFPQLAVGIPELGVRRFEPLAIDRIGLTKGSGPVTITGSFNDITVHGPSNATCTKARLDPTKGVFAFDIDLPTLRVEAAYSLRGNILLLPLAGHGDAILKIKNATTVITNQVVFRKIAGREVMHVVDMDVGFLVHDMTMHFTNLFNGNRVLGLTVNNFVNQNHKEILAELKEPLSESLSAVFRVILNQAFGRLPTDLWLLGDKEFQQYLDSRERKDDGKKVKTEVKELETPEKEKEKHKEEAKEPKKESKEDKKEELKKDEEKVEKKEAVKEVRKGSSKEEEEEEE